MNTWVGGTLVAFFIAFGLLGPMLAPYPEGHRDTENPLAEFGSLLSVSPAISLLPQSGGSTTFDVENLGSSKTSARRRPRHI